MSMTVTMNEAGMVELPPSVRKRFNLVGQTQLELDVREDGFTFRPRVSLDSSGTAPSLFATPAVSIVREGRLRVFSGGPKLTDEDVIRAIAADRDERTVAVMALGKQG